MASKKYDHTSCGPLQIVHDFKFTALNVKDDYSILDALDREGKLDHIKSRIDRLKRLGYGGVVMNVDYKGYLRNPDDFEIFFECARYAKQNGLRVWIYDEQYYPSGSAGGLTLIDHPELEAISLSCITKDFIIDETVGAIRVPSPCGYSELKYAIAAPVVNGEVQHDERIDVSDRKDLAGGLCFHAPVGEWRVWCFFIRPLYELTHFCRGTRASRRYVSVFNERAIERFYKVTFEDGYVAHAKEKLGSLVDAIFTDEPYSPFYIKYEKAPDAPRTIMPSCSIYDQPSTEIKILPYVPWEMTLPERYKERYSKDIALSLPDIFDETPTTKQARINFYALLSDMSKRSFPEQMSEKLGNEGVLLSGHYFGEENFDFHPIFYGDIIEHLSTMGIPGCDCLWSDIDRLRYYIACRLAPSAAHLSSENEVMIEASNMIDIDQSITLKKAKAAISVMMAHGITEITSYYSEKLLPENEMKEFTRHISTLSSLMRNGKCKVNTLLYYPFENLCADRYPMGIEEGNYNGEDHLRIAETSAALIKRQVCFDIINKKRLLSCKLCDGYLEAPNGERITHVVFPNIPWLDNDVAEFINQANKLGVNVLFNGAKRELCNLSFTPDFITDGAYPETELSLTEENPLITTIHREYEDRDLFLLVNTDEKAHSLNIEIKASCNNSFAIMDHLTGELTSLDTDVHDGMAHISLDIPDLGTAIIVRNK